MATLRPDGAGPIRAHCRISTPSLARLDLERPRRADPVADQTFHTHRRTAPSSDDLDDLALGLPAAQRVVTVVAAETRANTDPVMVSEPFDRLQFRRAACGQTDIGHQIPGGGHVARHPLGDLHGGLVPVSHPHSVTHCNT